MDFGANKTPVEIIREGAFGGSYFGDIYSIVNGKWYKKSWKEFNQLRNIDQKFCCSDFYDISVNKYDVKCGTSLRFWENRPLWLVSMEKIVSRFTGILVKMITDAGSKFDDYLISSKIRQILLHRDYELTDKDFFINSTN